MGNPAQVIAEVFGLYERFGDSDYIGEPVSQVEHMSQAAQRAMAEGFDDEVVLAAFFHDIGHICADVEGTRVLRTIERSQPAHAGISGRRYECCRG
jgi:predicted HD phosphohydrolase